MRRRGGDRGRLVTDSATFAQVRTDLQCSVRSKGGFHIISTLVQSLIGAEPAAVYSWSSGQVSDRVQLLHLHSSSSSTTNSGYLPSSILLLSNLPSRMKKMLLFWSLQVAPGGTGCTKMSTNDSPFGQSPTPCLLVSSTINNFPVPAHF